MLPELEVQENQLTFKDMAIAIDESGDTLGSMLMLQEEYFETINESIVSLSDSIADMTAQIIDTLENSVGTIANVTDDGGNNNENMLNVEEQRKTNTILGNLLTFFKRKGMSEQESRIDDDDAKSKERGPITNPNNSNLLDMLLGGTLGIVGALASGFAAGFASEIKRIFSAITKPIRSLFKSVRKSASSLKNIKAVKAMQSIASAINNSLKTVTFGLGPKFTDILKPVRMGIGFIKSQFKAFTAGLGAVRSILAPFLEIPSKIIKSMQKGMAFFNPILKHVKAFGAWFGRVSGWLALLLAAKAAWDSWMDSEGESLPDRLFGVVKDVIKEIVFLPIDMLKNAIAWVIKKMGGEDISEHMKDFSFQDSYDKIATFAWDMLKNAIDAIKTWISDFDFASMVDRVKEIFDTLVDSIVDFFKGVAAKLNPVNLVKDVAKGDGVAADVANAAIDTTEFIGESAKVTTDAISKAVGGLIDKISFWKDDTKGENILIQQPITSSSTNQSTTNVTFGSLKTTPDGQVIED